MIARSSLFAVALVIAALAPSTAMADEAPEPCDGADLGDACETFDGDAGTCQKQGSGNALQCVAGGGTTAAATAAATTTGATTAASSSGSTGGGEGSGGSAGGGESDDGCAVRPQTEKRATHLGAAAVLLLASAITLGRRLRRRG